MTSVDDASAALKAGSFVVIYDGEGREGEADLVLSAQFTSPEKVETLRRDAGGLICAAIDARDAEALGLPFYVDLLEQNAKLAGNPMLGELACRKTAYGEKPAFSISVNHRGVFTGITDNDRALTLKKLDELVRGRKGTGALAAEFYSPGHVPLLIGRGIANRRGHTELSLELAKRSGLGGAVVLCEMLGRGKALPKEEARAYATRNGLIFIEGKELI